MSAIDITRGDLVRAIGTLVAARPAVDAAVRARAEAIAAGFTAGGGEARAVRRGHGDHAVEAGGAGLAGRTFGAIESRPAPVAGRAAEADRG
jgi:hypothetical protein